MEPAIQLPPHVFVVLGGTGDLAMRKLLPALYRLHCRNAVPAASCILAAGLDDLSEAAFRARAHESVAASRGGRPPEGWWADRIFYQRLGQGEGGGFGALAARIGELERARALPGNRIYYLALPPKAVPDTVDHLAAAGLDRGPGWTRLVLEKPFGFDLPSARELDRRLHARFPEEQLYRIDHYLGKETVQNLMAFRFANPIFESLWNRDRVDHVQITVAEELGVEKRAGYYDGVGAVRDMLQNHLLQMLALVTMEVPTELAADAVHFEKVKALRAVSPLERGDVVLGQYTRGAFDGVSLPGYLDEPGIPGSSRTPTYVAVRLAVESWRWQGVPFYLRTGKRMRRKLSRISIVFREPPIKLFGPLKGCHATTPNVVDLTVQPDEGVAVHFQVKRPGSQPFELVPETLRFGYSGAFGKLADAYETLLYDVVEGDRTHFVASGAIEAGWRLVDPLLDDDRMPEPYPAGSWGPAAADALVERDGRAWLTARPELDQGPAPAAREPVRAEVASAE